MNNLLKNREELNVLVCVLITSLAGLSTILFAFFAGHLIAGAFVFVYCMTYVLSGSIGLIPQRVAKAICLICAGGLLGASIAAGFTLGIVVGTIFTLWELLAS